MSDDPTLIGPDGFTRLAGGVSGARSERDPWESAVIAAALASCMAHRSPIQRVLGTRRPCLACLQAAIRPHLVTAPERWQVRHIESGYILPCRDRAEAEAHVRESVSGPWVAEVVHLPAPTTPTDAAGGERGRA